MNLLIQYLKNYKLVVFVALLLAAINIGFSLLDPYITGLIVDRFIEKKDVLNRSEFVLGVLGLVGLGVGAAMVSRIAKNFQDYFTSIIVQKVGAQMYADGLKHSLELPYQVLKTSVVEKPWVFCRKFAWTVKSLSLPLSVSFL